MAGPLFLDLDGVLADFDRGVVAVFDPRMASANYRWDFVNSLPPMKRTKDRKVVEDFLAALNAND